ncbi:hypothetical protein [Echinicola vietnamensis]|uniref:Cytochrome B n=1 Tax=Echinicola vietnamensis (strain DSM 17526 / LMG 23754 / KMM 6221) TaxID=926556 RepID=L0G1T4_ECHVK|nr:hypothetical protein [Echinicola vietnamensis]AGA79273.1 hypothetical protein Echvi_3035 [Echinicola vietnamensis DSM 17526]
MQTGIQHLHSGMAYLVLAGLIAVFIYALIGALGNRNFTDKDRKFGLIGLIPLHIQLLVGIIIYFISPLGFSNMTSGNAMADSVSRLYALEHPLINIIAVVLVTVGYSRAKKLTQDRASFRSLYMFYGIALLLILSRIPWSAWM